MVAALLFIIVQGDQSSSHHSDGYDKEADL